MKRLLSIALCLVMSSWGAPALAEDASVEATFGPRPWLDDRPIAPSRATDSTGPLFAQAGDDDAAGSTDIEARIAELEARRNGIDTSRPRFWTITGAVMTGVGTVVGVVGLIACLGSSEAGAGCSAEHWAGFGTTAVLFTAAGIATLVPNERKLRERRAERRALELEIRELRERREAAASRSVPRLGFDPRSKAVTLGWVY